MKEITYRDFPAMVSAAVIMAVDSGTFADTNDVEIVVQDEDGHEYNITDVKFDITCGTVTIQFNHDNEDPEEFEELPSRLRTV